MSTDVYQKKVPYTYYIHNSKNYDSVFILRALIEYGASKVITYTDLRGDYTVPLLASEPKVLFKSLNEPISITFKFACPYRVCVCKMSRVKAREQRLQGKKVDACPFQRRIRFLDSCLITQSSLSAMIDDLHRVRASRSASIENTFPCTYRYAQTQGFSTQQFHAIAKGKFHMPYEICSSAAVMRSITSPPAANAFASALRGSTGLSNDEMDEFNEIWRVLNISDLFHLQTIYVACDTTHLADTLIYYLNELHRITGLWASHFITLASQALSSALYNCKDPDVPGRRIFLPFLNAEVYHKFEKALVGGYSVNSCFYSYFNSGFVEPDGHLDNTIRSASLLDFNGLYPRYCDIAKEGRDKHAILRRIT